jgi:hypothetical protein
MEEHIVPVMSSKFSVICLSILYIAVIFWYALAIREHYLASNAQ